MRSAIRLAHPGYQGPRPGPGGQQGPAGRVDKGRQAGQAVHMDPVGLDNLDDLSNLENLDDPDSRAGSPYTPSDRRRLHRAGRNTDRPTCKVYCSVSPRFGQVEQTRFQCLQHKHKLDIVSIAESVSYTHLTLPTNREV